MYLLSLIIKLFLFVFGGPQGEVLRDHWWRWHMRQCMDVPHMVPSTEPRSIMCKKGNLLSPNIIQSTILKQ